MSFKSFIWGRIREGRSRDTGVRDRAPRAGREKRPETKAEQTLRFGRHLMMIPHIHSPTSLLAVLLPVLSRRQYLCDPKCNVPTSAPLLRTQRNKYNLCGETKIGLQ